MARLILALLLLPSVAYAMPQAIPALLYFAGATATQVAIATIVVAVFTAYTARQQQKKRERQQRDTYNSALSDRNVTVVAASPPSTYIYGRATVAPVIVDILTSGDRDQYKHVVMAWARHQCAAIEDFIINGESVGDLDADGYVTSGKWSNARTEDFQEVRNFGASGTATISRDGATLVSVYRQIGIDEGVPIYEQFPGATLSGRTVSGVPANTSGVIINYRARTTTPRLRVRHYLGHPLQSVDPVLNGLFPGIWTSSFRGRGICYSVVTFDLDESEFQGGLPNCTATIKGRIVFDPRTNAFAWSDNPALCINDFLTRQHGKGVAQDQVVGVIEAANDCDQLIRFGDVEGKRYTCNGAFTSDDDPDTTLEALCKSMAGSASPGGVWRIAAGVYKTPVHILTEDDAAGSIEVIEAPGFRDTANGIRGQFYDPLQFNQIADYEPYQNTRYVSDDGGENWGTLNLPFTDSQRRCRTIAAIEVEQSRAKQVLFRGKTKCLACRVNDRAYLTMPVLGINNESFRVAKREFDLTSESVVLTLVGDAPEYYPVVSADDATSGPIDVERVGDVRSLDYFVQGTTAVLTYAQATNVNVTNGGALLIQTRRVSETSWTTRQAWPGNSTQASVTGLSGENVVRCAWRTAAGIQGDWAYISVTI